MKKNVINIRFFFFEKVINIRFSYYKKEEL